MATTTFDLIEEAARSGGSEAAFDILIGAVLKEKNYPLLFEARLMKKRLQLGLPLIPVESLNDLPKKARREYEKSYIEAAREVGGLFLADDNVPRAWPYFRAIGEIAPVAEAIESIQQEDDGIEQMIEIAFQEGVAPRKGFELMLAHHGVCRAITGFGQYPGPEGREHCLRLLVRRLHQDLVESLKRVIEQKEGRRPDAVSVPALIEGRDWLFGEHSYYIDTSHLVAVIRYSVGLQDRETLLLAVELTEYGKCLAPMFQSPGQPPFDNVYHDYGIYLGALLGENVDQAAAHFRGKVASLDRDEVGTAPAQALVELLTRLERYSDAIEVSLEYLGEVDPGQLACQSLTQLCQLAGDPGELMKIARQKDDLLSFTAGVLQS